MTESTIVTIKEVRELMQRVREIKANMPYAYGNTEQQIIETCNKLEAFGFSWGDNIRYFREKRPNNWLNI